MDEIELNGIEIRECVLEGDSMERNGNGNGTRGEASRGGKKYGNGKEGKQKMERGG